MSVYENVCEIIVVDHLPSLGSIVVLQMPRQVVEGQGRLQKTAFLWLYTSRRCSKIIENIIVKTRRILKNHVNIFKEVSSADCLSFFEDELMLEMTEMLEQNNMESLRQFCCSWDIQPLQQKHCLMQSWFQNGWRGCRSFKMTDEEILRGRFVFRCADAAD